MFGIREISNNRYIRSISGYPVLITRKKIKHLHLKICPPNGEIRLSAPLHVGYSIIEEFVSMKIPWIENAVTKVRTRKPTTNPEYRDGEKHYFLGTSYTLQITEQTGINRVMLRDGLVMDIRTRNISTADQRSLILTEWYRQRIKELIPGLLAAWEPVVGVQALEWGVKRMKTRWGSCNPAKKRIWLSLELVKRPVTCLEYILVHELTHFLEPSHNGRFYALLNSFMPDWRDSEKMLKDFNT